MSDIFCPSCNAEHDGSMDANGWATCLGAGWGKGQTNTRYSKDLDFLANTQARAAGTAFMQVKRAQWIGDLSGEDHVFGLHSGEYPGFWYGLGYYHYLIRFKNKQMKPLVMDLME